MKKATIVYILERRGNQTYVLMAKKKKKIGIGKWFGYGGKIENESPRACAVRETREESVNIILHEKTLTPVALVDFYKEDTLLFKTLFYTTWDYSGEPEETDEMADPTWFNIDNLPWHDIKAGDDLIIPHVIREAPHKGFIRFSQDEKEVLEYSIVPCSTEDLVI